MLNPDVRSLYTTAVTPPSGYVFDQALATTYSLDPAALLSLLTHLALANRTSAKSVDPILLLESLQRLAGRFSIYVDQAGIKPPSSSNVLYGLLESMVTPVKAPRGGVFHPKLWVIRFLQPGINEPPLIRLLILSRNITFDRSWDISLQLEGKPGGRYIRANRRLGEFLQTLPSLSERSIPRSRRQQAEQLSDEVRKTSWELPEGFESVIIHVLGMDGKTWEPPWAGRISVISPFVTGDALSWIGAGAEKFEAVVSRPEELNQLPLDAFDMAQHWYTLGEAAETEDGEEVEPHDTIGLHAKVYVLEKGWRTHLFIGSANATNAALRQCSNVEVLAELVGRTSQVGGIDKLLGEDGLGSILNEYVRPDEVPPKDEDEIRARKALEAARDQLVQAKLRVLCEPATKGWNLTLLTSEVIELNGISALYVWPITVSDDRAVNSKGSVCKDGVPLGRFGTESVTGLIAFDLHSKIKKMNLRLVLNLPVDGLPENRNDAILRLVLNNREGFLRYLLLLLGEYTGDILGTGDIFNRHGGSGSKQDIFSGEPPLLEELTRALSRHPEKLKDIERVICRLMRDGDTASLVPPQFMEIWEVFETVMEESKP
jgi:hypothetical protein